MRLIGIYIFADEFRRKLEKSEALTRVDHFLISLRFRRFQVLLSIINPLDVRTRLQIETIKQIRIY